MAWARYRHASISATNPQALGTCDRCGFTYQHNQLAWQHDWRGPRIQNLRILVCPTCTDIPQQSGQRTIIIPADPVPILNPRLDPNMISGAGPQYGSELVTNGGFASDDGWTLQNGASIYGGVLQFIDDNGLAGIALTTAADTLVSGVYKVSVDLVYSNSIGFSIIFLIGGVSSEEIVPDLGYSTTYTTQVTSTAATQILRIGCTLGGTNDVVALDNFSVVRVL